MRKILEIKIPTIKGFARFNFNKIDGSRMKSISCKDTNELGLILIDNFDPNQDLDEVYMIVREDDGEMDPFLYKQIENKLETLLQFISEKNEKYKDLPEYCSFVIAHRVHPNKPNIRQLVFFAGPFEGNELILDKICSKS